MEKKVRVRVVITGRVQGVFFRMATRNEANSNGIFGWVKNRLDGAVEAIFEGDKNAVDAMLEWCKSGPPHARVERVDIQWEDPVNGFEQFDIRY